MRSGSLSGISIELFLSVVVLSLAIKDCIKNIQCALCVSTSKAQVLFPVSFKGEKPLVHDRLIRKKKKIKNKNHIYSNNIRV